VAVIRNSIVRALTRTKDWTIHTQSRFASQIVVGILHNPKRTLLDIVAFEPICLITSLPARVGSVKIDFSEHSKIESSLKFDDADVASVIFTTSARCRITNPQ
jgi:hypothetical protein